MKEQSERVEHLEIDLGAEMKPMETGAKTEDSAPAPSDAGPGEPFLYHVVAAAEETLAAMCSEGLEFLRGQVEDR